MKKITFLLFCISMLCFVHSVQAQLANAKVGDTIVLRNWCTVLRHDIVVPISDTLVSSKFLDRLEPNVKFIVNSVNDSLVGLVAMNFDKYSPEKIAAGRAKNPAFFEKSEYYNGKLYVISRGDFDASAAKPESSDIITGGLISLPFKARPQGDFTFDTEFNINTTVNFRLAKINNTNFSVQFGAGIGTVNLNPAVAKGLVDDESQDVAVLSLLSGVMLQYKKVQVGLYAGVDQINNQSHYQWESNGNLWLGFGVGFSLYKISLGGQDKNKQN